MQSDFKAFFAGIVLGLLLFDIVLDALIFQASSEVSFLQWKSF